MQVYPALHRISGAMGRAMARRFARPEFTCGECERSASCGLPPSDDCPIKLEQIARDPTGYHRRMRALAALVKPGYWA